MQSLLTTPGKNRSSARSQSGSLHYLLDDVREDLNADLEKAQSCGLDNLIQHFIYLVLDPESSERKELDELQDEIEKLEEEVHSPKDAPNAPVGGEVKDDDSRALLVSRQKRDQILSTVYEECLNAVLATCNDHVVFGHLKEYAAETIEPDRYAPFVRSCNSALSRMSNLHTKNNLPLRDPSALDIRFKRNDPRFISHKYKGEAPAIQRKPDVIITSSISARDAAVKEGRDSKSNLSQKRKRRNEEEDEGEGVEEDEEQDEDDENEEQDEDDENEGAYKDDGEQRKRDAADEEEEYHLPPHRTFGWRHVLSCSEFKAVQKSFACAPTPSYEDTSRKATLPAKLPDLPARSSELPNPTSAQSSSVTSYTVSSSEDRREGKKRKVDSTDNAPDPLPVAQTMMKNREHSRTKTNSSDTAPKAANYGAAKSKDAITAKTQFASYALEMMSYSIGVHHAINLFFVDAHLWIFYFDRQGILQSNGIDLIDDLPRFLVLLLAFQRFELRDWGVIPELNHSPSLVHDPQPWVPPKERTRPVRTTTAPPPPPVVPPSESDKFEARKLIIEEFNLDLKTCMDIPWKWNDPVDPTNITLKPLSFVSHQPHSLAGRATAVIDASIPGLARDAVCKISNPEVQRTNEGDILLDIYEKCDKHDESLKKHVPEMLLYGDMKGCLTNRVRSMVGLSDWRGHRTTRFVILIKANPLTTLAGREFVRAWLETVKCHAFLWDHGIAHGDPSLWNLMFSAEHNCGVLGDYDLAIFLDKPRVRGTERTGTITFMAIELLNKQYWDGLIKRQYHHELEAFIWVLPFVFLRYQNQTVVPTTLVENWITSSYETCKEKKMVFWGQLSNYWNDVQEDFTNVWLIAYRLLLWASKQRAAREEKLGEERLLGTTNPDLNVEVPASLTRAGFIDILKSMQQEYLDDLLQSLGAVRPPPVV